MERRILLSGTGGQGVATAGDFLSEALFRAGYEVVNTRSYGAESRGGSSRSFVIASDGEIHDLDANRVDVLVAMSTPAYREYIGLVEGGIVLAEAEALGRLEEGEAKREVRTVSIPAFEAASMLGNPIVANMVFLGALAKLSELMTLEELKEAVRALMRPNLHDLNVKALEAGYAMV